MSTRYFTAKVATTANVNISTELEAGDIIDGYTLVAYDNVLVRVQTNPVENGLYYVQPSGSAVRSDFYEAGLQASLTVVNVGNGTIHDHTLWICTNSEGSDIIGTDGLTYTLFKHELTHTTVNVATYTADPHDDIIGVTYTQTGTCTVTLPLISTVGKKRYRVTDEGGNAKKNRITIAVSGADTICGETSTTVRNNYNSLSIYNNGVDAWFLE